MASAQSSQSTPFAGDQACGTRLVNNTITGSLLGMVTSFVRTSYGAASVVAPVASGAFAASAYGIVPACAAMAAVYTGVDCVVGAATGARDWRSAAAGSAAAGVVASVARGGPAGGVVSAALIFGAIGAASGVFERLEPFVEAPAVKGVAGTISARDTAVSARGGIATRLL